MVFRHRVGWRVPAAASVILFAGCDGCPGSKPYTPYTLDAGAAASGAPSGSAVAEVDAAAPDGGPSYPPMLGVKAPGDGKSWPLEGGKQVPAPTGRTFETGIVLDADGEGQKDLIAWASAPDRLRGELWYASGDKPEATKTVLAMPADISARGCTPAVSVAQVGPRTLSLDVALKCARPGKDHPSRWVAVVRLGDPAAANAGFAARTRPELGMEVRVATLPADESLTVAVDASDRDGDGRDDISLTPTLTGAVKPLVAGAPTSAILRYFDRPSGFSRDPAEPAASIGARASGLVAEARRKGGAAGVAAGARQLRRLRDALCAESAALVTVSAGSTQCGGAGLEDSTFAEALAGLTIGDPARALAAAATLDALSSSKGPRKKELEKAIAKQVPNIGAMALHTVTAAPAGPKPPAPSWGPLAFEASGDLLVRTDAGVVRVDHASFAEAAVEGAAWAAPLGPSAWQLVGVEQRCDEPTLIAVAKTAGGKVDVSLPVPTPVGQDGLARRGPCTSIPAVRVTPLGSSPNGFVVAVGGELVGIGGEGDKISAAPVGFPLPLDSIARGAARSPDGSTIALPLSNGVLLWTASKGGALWTGGDLGRAWGCVPASGAARLACVVDKAAVIFAEAGHP